MPDPSLRPKANKYVKRRKWDVCVELGRKGKSFDPRLCPCCGGRMITREMLHPKRYLPPEGKVLAA